MRNLSTVEGESGRRQTALRFRHELATILRKWASRGAVRRPATTALPQFLSHQVSEANFYGGNDRTNRHDSPALVHRQ